MSDASLNFGWFLPTSGDSSNLADPAARIPQSPELFDDIVEAVDNGGYQYMLLPVNAFCWEATVVSSYYVAKTRNLAPLIALRSGYMNPTLAAKMFATLDQMSRGRLCINLIAGINDDDTRGDGVLDTKEVRYEKMDEEVEIMKRLWAADEPIGFNGKHYQVDTVMQPTTFQRPHPPFFLGGGSDHPHIDVSNFMLCFLTQKWFINAPCLVEFVRAILRKTPMIALLDPESPVPIGHLAHIAASVEVSSLVR